LADGGTGRVIDGFCMDMLDKKLTVRPLYQ
jgi:hypothetical protein